MIPFGTMLLLSATAASSTVPYIVDQFRRGSQDVSFRASQRTEPGIADYFVYEEVLAPDLMLTTYGALGTTYEIIWNDTSVMSDDDRIRHCAWLNDAMRKIAHLVESNTGWMMQTHAICSRAAARDFPTYIASDGHRVLAEARDEYLADKRSVMRNLLSLTYLPAATKRNSLINLFISGEAPIETAFDRVNADFIRGLQAVEDSLRRVARIRRLGTHPVDPRRSEFLEAIFQILYDDEQPIVVGDPFVPSPVGGLLGARDINPVGMHPKIGEKHLRVLSIYEFPGRSNPTMLDAFLKASAPGCRFTTRSIFQDSEVARKRLDTMRRMAAGGKTNLIQAAIPSTSNGPPRVDRLAQIKEEKAEEALLAAALNEVAWVHFSAKVVFLDEDLETLDANVRSIRKALQGEGFTVNLESLNTLNAYFGHVPFDGYHDVREGQVHSANVSRFWASSSRWPGRTTWVCKHCGPETVPALSGLTDTGEDFSFDPHEEDSQSFAAYGYPGAGKTTFLNALAAEYLRTPNDLVMSVDKNYGQLVTCRFLSGDYRENARYWLFGNLESQTKRDFLAMYFANLARLNGVKVEHLDVFAETLQLLVEHRHQQHRTLTQFLNIFSANDARGDITEVLRYYAIGGVYNGVLDGAYNPNIGNSQYEVHELGGLLGGNANDLVAAPVLIWLLQSFEERLPGHRSIILVDEAWASLKSPLVAPIIDDQLRTLRFRHSGMGFFTHNIADVRDSAIGKTVSAACKTRLLFPNPDANGEFRKFFLEDLECTQAQINIIKNGALKRDVNMQANGRFGAFRKPLSPAEAAVYGCTGKDEVDAARVLMAEHPEDWREWHLNAYGCHREADRLRSLRLGREMNTYTLQSAIAF